MSALLPYYDWLKAGHVIFVIFWMAGLFMLPRYLAYHCETPVGSAESEVWKTREARLLRIILNPAMIVAWIFGLLLAAAGDWFAQPWLHAKLLLVVLLSGFHGFLAGQARKFARDAGLRNGRTWRLLNEIPSFAAIAIVILVVVKPF
jgi:putative membrane protein